MLHSFSFVCQYGNLTFIFISIYAFREVAGAGLGGVFTEYYGFTFGANCVAAWTLCVVSISSVFHADTSSFTLIVIMIDPKNRQMHFHDLLFVSMQFSVSMSLDKWNVPHIIYSRDLSHTLLINSLSVPFHLHNWFPGRGSILILHSWDDLSRLLDRK